MQTFAGNRKLDEIIKIVQDKGYPLSIEGLKMGCDWIQFGGY